MKDNNENAMFSDMNNWWPFPIQLFIHWLRSTATTTKDGNKKFTITITVCNVMNIFYVAYKLYYVKLLKLTHENYRYIVNKRQTKTYNYHSNVIIVLINWIKMLLDREHSINERMINICFQWFFLLLSFPLFAFGFLIDYYRTCSTLNDNQPNLNTFL